MKDLSSVDFNSSKEVKSSQKILARDVNNLLYTLDTELINRIVESNTKTYITIKEDGVREIHRIDITDQVTFDDEKDFIENGYLIFFPRNEIRDKLNIISNKSKAILYYTYFNQDIHIGFAIIFEDKIRVYVR